ncbi:MAG: antitoxin VapB family protein [Verrucomicrobiota bacterium]
MKTITLTDEAYARLSTWKESPKDSFSKVVERVVPARGSLSSVMVTWENLSALSVKQFEVIESGLREVNDWSKQKDPWTI